MNSQLIRMEASLNGFAEGIALDSNGHVSEGSGMNIFLVHDNILFTPPLAASNDRQHFRVIKSGRDILPPVKRDAVARREPPEEPMHAAAEMRCNRGVAIRGDEEAVVFETGNAERDCLRRILAHHRAMHVRAIGEVQHRERF